MKNIDFLPDVYRQREALRQARLWWCAVVLIFGTAISMAAGAQLWLRRNIQQQLNELDDQFAASQGQIRELAKLQTEIAKAGRAASLFTFLEDPWPRSQILAEVVRPLPASVRLTSVHVGEEALEKPQPEAGPRRRGARHEEDQGPKLSAAEADLATLRTEAERRQTFVELEGQTQDVPQLHHYVAQLGRSTLVAAAQIKSLEAVTDENQQMRTSFTLRVIIRPGYCTSASVPQTAAQKTPKPAPGSASATLSSQSAQGGKPS